MRTFSACALSESPAASCSMSSRTVESEGRGLGVGINLKSWCAHNGGGAERERERSKKNQDSEREYAIKWAHCHSICTHTHTQTHKHALVAAVLAQAPENARLLCGILLLAHRRSRIDCEVFDPRAVKRGDLDVTTLGALLGRRLGRALDRELGRRRVGRGVYASVAQVRGTGFAAAKPAALRGGKTRGAIIILIGAEKNGERMVLYAP